MSQDVRLCTRCANPVEPLDHYCPICGECSGCYTSYIPWVNIEFEYKVWGELWKRFWYDPAVEFRTKIGYAVLLAFSAPLMFVGLPFVLIDRVTTR